MAAFVRPCRCMSSQPDPPPSFTLEIVIATAVGVALGVVLDHLAIGIGVGIALGAILSVLKMRKGPGGR